MKNRYQSYSDFVIRQPFFSFDVKNYQETVCQKPFAARFYQFSTQKHIDRAGKELFMCCIPDGCVDIVFIHRNRQNCMELIGSPFCRKSLIVYPDAAYFGVRLKPGMFFPDETVCLREVTNTETFVPQLPERVNVLLEQLFAADSLDARSQLFLHYLTQFSPEEYTVDETIQEVLYLTSRSNGNVEVSEIAKAVCYSERHLTRMFSDAMGYSPKMYARIARFQFALSQMMEHSTDSVSSFIEVLNYADQAHFQREFKEFTGLTPKNFTRYIQTSKAAAVCPSGLNLRA